MEVKCKDYIIFKARVYADKRLLDKWSENGGAKEGNPLPKQHYTRAMSYYDFFWSMFTHISGVDKDTWVQNHMYESVKCAEDYLQENVGILMQTGEGNHIIMIPRGEEELVEWVRESLFENNVPFKILQKTHLGYLAYGCVERDLQYWRNESRRFTVEMREKLEARKSERLSLEK